LLIAKRTRGIAVQSIVVGLALSGAAMIFAAMGQITPVAGALLQEGIDVAVILNALRALGDGRFERIPREMKDHDAGKSGGLHQMRRDQSPATLPRR